MMNDDDECDDDDAGGYEWLSDDRSIEDENDNRT